MKSDQLLSIVHIPFTPEEILALEKLAPGISHDQAIRQIVRCELIHKGLIPETISPKPTQENSQ